MTEFPAEVVSRILSYLSTKDQLKLSRINSEWRHALQFLSLFEDGADILNLLPHSFGNPTHNNNFQETSNKFDFLISNLNTTMQQIWSQPKKRASFFWPLDLSRKFGQNSELTNETWFRKAKLPSLLFWIVENLGNDELSFEELSEKIRSMKISPPNIRDSTVSSFSAQSHAKNKKQKKIGASNCKNYEKIYALLKKDGVISESEQEIVWENTEFYTRSCTDSDLNGPLAFIFGYERYISKLEIITLMISYFLKFLQTVEKYMKFEEFDQKKDVKDVSSEIVLMMKGFLKFFLIFLIHEAEEYIFHFRKTEENATNLSFFEIENLPLLCEKQKEAFVSLRLVFDLLGFFASKSATNNSFIEKKLIFSNYENSESLEENEQKQNNDIMPVFSIVETKNEPDSGNVSQNFLKISFSLSFIALKIRESCSRLFRSNFTQNFDLKSLEDLTKIAKNHEIAFHDQASDQNNQSLPKFENDSLNSCNLPQEKQENLLDFWKLFGISEKRTEISQFYGKISFIFTRFTPKQFAEQLTVFDFENFRRIRYHEFFGS